VGVLNAEPGQVDDRVAVGDVVAVLVGVEQQVGGVHHPDAVVAGPRPPRPGRALVAIDRPGHERLGRPERAVAVDVFQDGDRVPPGGVVRRDGRHLVELRPDELVVLDHLQPGRERVLHVLHDPHPPALVEVEAQRLADRRLRRDQVDRQPPAAA
jgi:hypothetical protein